MKFDSFWRSGVAILAGLIMQTAASPVGAGQDNLPSLIPEAPRTRLTDQTHVFIRGQFKAGLKANDHFNRYVDRPLFLDPTQDDPESRFLEDVSLLKRYDLSGFAFFPENGRCDLIYDYLNRSRVSRDFRLLTEFVSTDAPERKIAIAKQALANPYSFRINDKVVFSSYTADRRSPAFWKALMAKIREAHGDHFLFVPCVTNFGKVPLGTWLQKYDQGEITEADIELAREDLRRWLRATDGIYFSATTIVRDDLRRFDEGFYRDFIIRTMKSVLAEEEFKGKIFGLSAKIGHENHTRMGRTLSSDGTKTYRRSMEAALAAEPEFINIPEWDELNESTCIMPTLYDGMTFMRISRYYQARQRGEALKPMPGDRGAAPNLILSYRKTLALGEVLEIEVLEVPDSDSPVTTTARVELLDGEGKVVHRWPRLRFDGKVLRDETVSIPTEKLATHRLLLPRVTVERDGEETVFEKGLQSIELRPVGHWDYKWARHPLRELLEVDALALEVAPDAEDPLMAVVKGKLESNEPLAYLEVLEDQMTVYSHHPGLPPQRESEEELFIGIAWKSADGYRNSTELKGSLTLQEGAGRWIVPQSPDDNWSANGLTLPLDGRRANIGTASESRRVLLAVERSSVEKANLLVKMPGIYEGFIPVSQLARDGVYAIPGPHHFTMVLTRFARQHVMPPHLGANGGSFEIKVAPLTDASVYHLVAIGESGRTYRSKPVVFRRKPPVEGTAEVAVFSDDRQSALRVAVNKADLPVYRYRFDPQYGALLPTDKGLAFWGVLGGYVNMTSMRGAAPGDGASIFPGQHPGEYPFTAPKWVELEGGGHALEFDGKGSLVTFPQGVISRRAGYRISMDVYPMEAKGRQVLIANYTSRFGTLAVALENGAVKIDFLHDLVHRGMPRSDDLDTGAKLEIGKWSHLVVAYDQEKLVVEVDGVASKPLSVPGPGAHDTVSVLGGKGSEWFRGRVKSLSIDYHQPQAPAGTAAHDAAGVSR